MIDQSRAYQYAKWCTQRGNRKVGKYVKLQAKKWLRIADGRHKDAYVSEKAYRKICKLLKLMIHPDLHCSMYDGLEDYAWFLIAAVFCTRRREDDRRFYQTAILEIARKNFKTFNSAIIFILGMLTEPRFSRFFSVAPDFKLSSELRLAVRKIIKVSPALTKYFKINRDMITCLINEIEYTPLAYSNDGMDGRLANIFLADEAGALDSYPVEAMRSSQITLVNKLGIIISTQYPNDNNVMIDEVDIAKKVLDGVLEKENVFALLYEPDDALRKRWETDDLVIYQANPVAVNNKEVFDSIKDLRTMAILYENKRENFLCKHCNIMYKGLGVEGYIDVQKVRRCRVAENLDFWCGRRVWVGLDLSQSDDNTSVAMVTEADGVIHAKVWGILPKDRIEIKTKKENVDYAWTIRKTCPAYVETDIHDNLFSAAGTRARGAKITIRPDSRLTLHEAMRWNGKFLFLTSIELSEQRDRQELQAAVCESVTLTARPQDRTGRDTYNRPVAVSVPSFTFPGILTEKYFRNEADDVYRAEVQQRVLVTPKVIVLRAGDLVQKGNETPYTVRQVLDLDPYKNEYVVERSWEA